MYAPGLYWRVRVPLPARAIGSELKAGPTVLSGRFPMIGLQSAESGACEGPLAEWGVGCAAPDLPVVLLPILS